MHWMETCRFFSTGSPNRAEARLLRGFKHLWQPRKWLLVLNWIIAGSRMCQSGRCTAGMVPLLAASLTASVAHFLAEVPPGSGGRSRGLSDWHELVWLWHEWYMIEQVEQEKSQTHAQTHSMVHHSNTPGGCESVEQPMKWTFRVNSEDGRQHYFFIKSETFFFKLQAKKSIARSLLTLMFSNWPTHIGCCQYEWIQWMWGCIWFLRWWSHQNKKWQMNFWRKLWTFFQQFEDLKASVWLLAVIREIPSSVLQLPFSVSWLNKFFL